ncbi:MAG: homocysteine S-methyltransferase family protein [Planctomycetota bacterium]|jgi:5-methyltetrahydrofolate--homocysteine methyltransferase
MELEKALNSGIVLCDGAMGTQLINTGLPSGMPTACCNVICPDRILSIHKKYISVGAQAILTNTFDANRLKLKGHKEYDVKELNRVGVELARQASASTDVMVFGDIGPSGNEQSFLYSLQEGRTIANKAKQDLYDIFKEQVIALTEIGVDAILIETMSYLQEAIIATKAAAENTEIPVICTMVFRTPPDSRPSDFRTLWGDTLPDIVNGLIEAGATGIGANCGDIVEAMPRLAQQMRNMTPLPLVFQVNAGRAELDVQTNQTVHPLDPAGFGQLISQVAAEGASVVGGCCGTTPNHIEAARRCLNR